MEAVAVTIMNITSGIEGGFQHFLLLQGLPIKSLPFHYSSVYKVTTTIIWNNTLFYTVYKNARTMFISFHCSLAISFPIR